MLATPRGGRLPVAADALVTPLARQAASDRRVQLEPVPGAAVEAGRTVAAARPPAWSPWGPTMAAWP